MSMTHLKRRRSATSLATRSKRFWIGAALAMAIAYPLSLGPLMWFCDRGLIYEPVKAVLEPIYAPLGVIQLLSPVERTMSWYVGLWCTAASDDITDDAVFQTDIMPDGRKGISFVDL